MVRKSKITLPMANMGVNNPFPDIKNVGYIHAGYHLEPEISEEEKKYIGKGMIGTLLPYQLQDDYDRERRVRSMETVVLENEKLRATFLPSCGGRLWSLFDLSENRELLYVNTVFQPANFALRNAWFSGGVEFNIGIKGHTPLTCSALFCDMGKAGDSIRMYGYERIRGVAYCITAYLPQGSDVLYIRNSIENSKDCDVPMYWWSNIAVPETEATRVIVPTDDAIGCLYRENHYTLGKTSIPVTNAPPVGVDVSYPARLPFSADYFYKLPKEEEKWIAAVNEDGRGLLQFSDHRLCGRKLFIWGGGKGGRHWNEFLSEPGQAYIEIQAGLATTQMEHIPMPAGSRWEWTEGYTGIACDPQMAHGDWQQAITEVKTQLHRHAVQPEKLSSIVFPSEYVALCSGDGWGGLEQRVRRFSGGSSLSRQVVFPETRDAETGEWHELLDGGILSCEDLAKAPASYVTGAFWRETVLRSFEREGGRNWYALMQLGIILYAEGDLAGAEAAWNESAARTPNLWAYRNLAMLWKSEYGDMEKALQAMQKAAAFKPDIRAFHAEYANLLTSCGHDAEWIEYCNALPDVQQQHGRLQFFRALALLHLGEAEKAAQIITPDFVMCDVKEGELSLSKLWFDIYAEIIRKRDGVDKEHARQAAAEAYPLPYSLDFRMH